MKANVPGTPRVYRFGAFVVDARTGELTTDDRRTLLREQPLQLLLALLDQPGELITREELTKRLWPAGTFVDFDRGLNKAINHLREALKDSAEHPQFIETLPRKGYRFIAPVSHDPQIPDQAPAGDAHRPTFRVWQALVVCIVAAAALAIAVDAGGARRWLSGRWNSSPRITSIAVLPLENLSPPEQDYFADGVTDALTTEHQAAQLAAQGAAA